MWKFDHRIKHAKSNPHYIFDASESIHVPTPELDWIQTAARQSFQLRLCSGLDYRYLKSSFSNELHTGIKQKRQ